MSEPRRLRVGNHHDTSDYATVIEHEGNADRGVLFATVVGPGANERAREVCDAVNAARGELPGLRPLPADTAWLQTEPHSRIRRSGVEGR